MIIFWFKEAFRIFGRAKSSFILSLISLTVSILLITASIYSIFLTHHIQEKIKRQFIINIFLDDSLSAASISEIQSKLEDRNYISSLSFIDKETAAKTFVKETGEDFRKILDYNPIPASFLLKLKPDYVEKDSVQLIKKELLQFGGIDEIVFEQELLEKLVNTLQKIQTYIFIITVVLVLISIYITYSTIRLIISLKHDELETMKLVGAKLSTIKMPIVLNEIMTGMLASIISVSLVKLFFLYANKLVTLFEFKQPPLELFVIILLIGPLISCLVSIVVLRKITLKI